MKTKVHKGELTLFLIANVGIIFLTISINFLAWKYRLVSAGITGYALAASYLLPFSVGTLLLIMNGIILLANVLILGKSAGLKAFYGYITFSLMIDLTRTMFQLKKTPVDSFFTQFVFLSLLAVCIAVFISLIIATGYSVGSYSALYPLINKYYRLSAAHLFFIGDAILTIITLFLFGAEKAALLFLHTLILSFSLKYALPFIKKYVGVVK